MELYIRYIWLKCELERIKTELDAQYHTFPLDKYEIEKLLIVQERYKSELYSLDSHLKKALKDTEDLRLKVYILHYCYRWPLKKIAKQYHYSLSHIKRISSLLHKELSKKKQK